MWLIRVISNSGNAVAGEISGSYLRNQTVDTSIVANKFSHEWENFGRSFAVVRKKLIHQISTESLINTYERSLKSVER